MNVDEMRALCRAPLPHPDLDTLRQAFAHVQALALEDFVNLPAQSIGTTATRLHMEALLRQPAPVEGQPLLQVLREFQEVVAPYALRPQHPRFWAFVPSAPTMVSVLGDWLTAAFNFFAGVWLEAAGPAEVELIVLDWFKELLGYPHEAAGVLTSGGSEANLLALVVAREPLSWDERARAVLYLSGQRHRSIDRAAKIMGLRPEQLRPLPVGADFRMNVDDLRAAVNEDERAGRLPWAVVANVGSTDTGAVDPLDALATLCQQCKLWLHVDAAYGWAAVFDNAERRQLTGIEQADSLTLDPHKWFGQTFEAGCVLVRAGERLTDTFRYFADYMQDVQAGDDEVNFADRGLALTRRFRALKIWLSLKVLGVDWYRQLVAHCCRLAELAQALLEQRGFEILSRRGLSIVCFRAAGEGNLDQLNLSLCEEARKTGRVFLSTTKVHGKVALRMCFVNWRTTAADVEEGVRLLAELLESRI